MPSRRRSANRTVRSANPINDNTSTSTQDVGDDDNNVLASDTSLSLYIPNIQVSFKLFLCAGFTSAVWLHITDCDETFNYWEPSHYFLFGKGFQTWEYAPQYALRSYAYILLHSIPAWLYYYVFQPSHLLIFYFLRFVLGVVFTICGVYFYKSTCCEFGVNVGRIMIVFMVFSPGFYISSTAYLPSSFAMYMTMLSVGAWFQRRYRLAILSTAFSTFICWPFVAVIGLPIALDVVFRMKRISMLIMWSTVAVICFLILQVEIDSVYYGRFVIAPWNIIKYNLLTSHGPNLYGEEPWYFYFVNGFLNFNIAFILALCTPLLLICVNLFVSKKIRHPSCLPYQLSLISFYLWFIIFCLQPHKEERFMFPAYPLLCLCAAVSVDAGQMLLFRTFINNGSHYLKSTARYAGILLVLFAVLGVSRILALYKAYHGPMDIYIELVRFDNEIKGNSINLCLGKEWHRYPSSFFLPSNRWDAYFVKSEFNGLLPGKYSKEHGATALIRHDMNDQNKEEPSHYVSVDICDLLIDLDTNTHTDLEPDYSHHSNWTVVYSSTFLDVKRTPRLVRAFYIPGVWSTHAHFLSYNLLMKYNIVANNKIHRNID